MWGVSSSGLQLLLLPCKVLVLLEGAGVTGLLDGTV